MNARWIIVAAALLLAPACSREVKPRGEVEASTTNELGERQTIQRHVAALVRSRDFAALNQMAKEFRTRRSRTPSGVWKLSIFYSGFPAALPGTAGSCVNNGVSFAKDWSKADPSQPGPYILEASALMGSGWCFRGAGYASEVSDEAMAAFNQHVAAAYQLLETHREVASVDPHFYTVMVQIYTAQGRGGWAFENLLDEAADREPYYYETYFAAAQYYLPQWYGDSGDIDWLARFAADHTKQGDGMGAYARVFWATMDSYAGVESEIDWSTMEQAMQDVTRAYPNEWNAANFARLSCREGRLDTAATFIGKLPKPSLWAEWMKCPPSTPGLPAPRPPIEQTIVSSERSTARCPFAAQEDWSKADFDTYCSSSALRRHFGDKNF